MESRKEIEDRMSQRLQDMSQANLAAQAALANRLTQSPLGDPVMPPPRHPLLVVDPPLTRDQQAQLVAILDKLKAKYAEKEIALAEKGSLGGPFFFGGVCEGLGYASKIIMGIEDDYLSETA